MGRNVAAVIAAIAAWFVLVSAMDIAMRSLWPDYAAVFHQMTFTLPMMAARLGESTVALIVASLIAVRIATASRAAAWALGIVMLAVFVPIHYGLWTRFPLWYHAYFLASLIAVPVLIAALAGRRAAEPSDG